MTSWYQPLEAFQSLGSQHAGGGGLAGLHQARAEHLAQFFTPRSIAAIMWDIASPAMKRAHAAKGVDTRVTLFDNSVGSGRLLQFASPELHTLAGCDIHEPSISALSRTAEAAGFQCDFVNAAMQDVRPGHYNVAFINPPFSIHLDSPNVEPYDCNTYGRFGEKSACLSHVYSLAQALDYASVVVALIPTTFADRVTSDPFFNPRLRLVLDLPGNAFSDEGAEVATSIAVFDAFSGQGWSREKLADLSSYSAPDLELNCGNINSVRARAIRPIGISESSPTILLPVTGDNTVSVVRHNRRIVLKYRCGLVQAKVANSILRASLSHFDRPPGYRYAVGAMYTGEGCLDLQVHLMQADPVASFRSLLAQIKAAGGEPVADSGIEGYLRRQAKRLARHRQPLGLSVMTDAMDLAAESSTVIPLKPFSADPKSWTSLMFKAGTAYTATRTAPGQWSVALAGKSYPFSDAVLATRFRLADAGPASRWIQKFPGRSAAFPKVAAHAARKAKALGLDRFLSWGYQFDDLCELAISPFGAAAVWEMGLGKARLSIGLALLRGGKHSLIVVEPHLVDEMVTELKSAPIAASDWQVIDSVRSVRSLKKINVITYNRLGRGLGPGAKRTYGHALRNRISTCVCDEGHHLRSTESDRTRAVWQVNARNRYLMTGTPIANYPRDVYPLIQYLGGDGTAAQPYGLRRSFLEANHILTTKESRRGMDVFRENFVTLEWSVNEFNDSLREGAKREIPKINNLPEFRMILAPFFKRRVMDEPDVAKFVSIPRHTQTTNSVPWDSAHFEYYVRVAKDFAEWYRKAHESASSQRKNLNLITILARIGAVETACNHPAAGLDGFGAYCRPTSKQRKVLDRALQFVAEGHKTIVYAKSPALLERLAAEASSRGVESVVIHGGKDIKARTIELNERFRFGSVNLLFASLGTTQTGLNLWQASRVLFLSRDWRAITERQALARVLRPQQKSKVLAEFYHLAGSIDDYQAQLVGFKGDAADSALDWAAPTKADDEFLHIDQILGAFCKGVGELTSPVATEVSEMVTA